MLINSPEMAFGIVINVSFLLSWYIWCWMCTSFDRFKFKSFWYSHYHLKSSGSSKLQTKKNTINNAQNQLHHLILHLWDFPTSLITLVFHMLLQQTAQSRIVRESASIFV